MRREFIPLAVITALAAAAIYFFVLRPEPIPDAALPGGSILIPISPIGAVSEPPAQFSWRNLKGVRAYEVEVFDQAMTLIWAGETRETTLEFPAELRDLLIGGDALFYRISAKGRMGKRLLSSEPVLFRLSNAENRGVGN